MSCLFAVAREARSSVAPAVVVEFGLDPVVQVEELSSDHPVLLALLY